MKYLRLLARNEEGSVLVYFGIMLIGLLALFAIAVDLGLWFNTKGEAQRVADAAALAGAGVFMQDKSPHSLVGAAEDTARAFASANYVGSYLVEASNEAGEVDVSVDPDSMSVSVTVRGGTPPWFAKLLGYNQLSVAAQAEARVRNADGATCVKPFAIPDMWEDLDDDINGNGLEDNNEKWEFSPSVDRYKKWTSGDNNATGYGSQIRDGSGSPPYTGDLGRTVIIKIRAGSGGGGGSGAIAPGNFTPWAMGKDTGNRGGKEYEENIKGCNREVFVGQEYFTEPGNIQGPTTKGINFLMDSDPTARWNASINGVESPLGTNSPRVIKVAFYDPSQIIDMRGRNPIVFNNFAQFFLEGYDANGNVIARFMKYAEGSTAGNNGSLVRLLQLVK